MARLIQCFHCKEIIHLRDTAKACGCGAVGGAKASKDTYTVWGPHIPIEINMDNLKAHMKDNLVTWAYVEHKGIIPLANNSKIENKPKEDIKPSIIKNLF